MTVFLVIGVVGLLVVVAALVLGDFLEGAFEAIDSGWLSAPVLGSFLAAFGFGAVLVMAATDAGTVPGALSGLVAGAAVGAAALAMTRSLTNMRTDPSVRLSDIVGKNATVITRIPEGGYGEVTLVHLGQIQKLAARSQNPVAAGSVVVVTAVMSSSSVMVEPVGG